MIGSVKCWTHRSVVCSAKSENEGTSVRTLERVWSWRWFSKGELVPPSPLWWRVLWRDHGRIGRSQGVGMRRRFRTTADTALKSEEGADLCADARFLALGVRQIEVRRGQV